MRSLVIVILALAGQVEAADGARLYASCAACHGTAGAGSGTALPILAGQPKDTLLNKLRAYRAGTLPATIMQQLAKGYSDEELEAIAAYLAAQKLPP